MVEGRRKEGGRRGGGGKEEEGNRKGERWRKGREGNKLEGREQEWREAGCSKTHIVWVVIVVAPLEKNEEHQPAKYTHQEEHLQG